MTIHHASEFKFGRQHKAPFAPLRLEPIVTNRGRILGHGQQLASERFAAHVKAHPVDMPRDKSRQEIRRVECAHRKMYLKSRQRFLDREFLEADRKLTPRPKPEPSSWDGIPRKRIMHRP